MANGAAAGSGEATVGKSVDERYQVADEREPPDCSGLQHVLTTTGELDDRSDNDDANVTAMAVDLAHGNAVGGALQCRRLLHSWASIEFE